MYQELQSNVHRASYITNFLSSGSEIGGEGVWQSLKTYSALQNADKAKSSD